MILQLKVPFLETFARGGRVVSWQVAEGDLVEFGDAICVIGLSEWVALRKTKRALNLARIEGKGRGKVRNEFEVRQDRGLLNMRVVASESGYLRRIHAGEGAPVKLDDLLAVFSTEPGEIVPEDYSSASSMRVVATTEEVREGTA